MIVGWVLIFMVIFYSVVGYRLYLISEETPAEVMMDIVTIYALLGLIFAMVIVRFYGTKK